MQPPTPCPNWQHSASPFTHFHREWRLLPFLLSPLAFCRAHRRLLQPDEMCFRRWFVISHRHISFISFHFICFRFISFSFAVCIVALSLFCYSIMNTATHFTARLKKKKKTNKKHGAWLTQSSQGISAEFSKFLQNSFNGKVEERSSRSIKAFLFSACQQLHTLILISFITINIAFDSLIILYIIQLEIFSLIVK